MEWYYRNGDQQVGPVTDDALKELITSGVILATTPVWRKGMVAWSEAGETELAVSLIKPPNEENGLPPKYPGPNPKAVPLHCNRSTLVKTRLQHFEVITAVVCLIITLICAVIKGNMFPKTMGAVYDVVGTVRVVAFLIFAVMVIDFAILKIYRTLSLMILSVIVISYFNTKIGEYARERYLDDLRGKYSIETAQGEDNLAEWENVKFPNVTIRCPPGSIIQSDTYSVWNPAYSNMFMLVDVNVLATDNSTSNTLDNVMRWALANCQLRGFQPIDNGFSHSIYQLNESFQTSLYRCTSLSSNGSQRCDVVVPVGPTIVRGILINNPGDTEQSLMFYDWVKATCSGLISK